ncbi:hypothetical protein [Deinococcus cellulosilyticus]|nr:hypothetical protein [Deinococcus cellulosilyticus]
MAHATSLQVSLDHKVLTAKLGTKVLWKSPADGLPPTTSFGPGPLLPRFQLAGRVVYLSSCSSQNAMVCFTDGFDKWTGRLLFRVYGLPVAVGQGELLLNEVTHMAGMSFLSVEGTRVNLRTGKSVPVRFQIPPRKGCGNLNLSVAQIARTRFDSTFAYAGQEDRCGTFVARFNWHGPDSQKPVIMTDPLKSK